MKQQIDILAQYADTVAKVECLEKDIGKLEDKLYKLTNTDYGIASDIVSKGKRGKKSLGTVKITGVRTKEYIATQNKLESKKCALGLLVVELLELRMEVWNFIEGMENIEFRNLLSFHCIEGMSWKQVAQAMNGIYERKRRYTEDNCLKKYNRYADRYL